MKIGKLFRRFLVPARFVSVYYLLKFGSRVSPRAEVELSPNLTIGRGTDISSFVKLKASAGPVRIGRRVSIATGCFISPHSAGIVIGDDSLIGPNCVIVAGNYRYERMDRTLRDQGDTSKGIRIGKDVWLGGNVSVLDGAEIGDQTIVMAGSVVSGRLPQGVVASGQPAKVVFKRRPCSGSARQQASGLDRAPDAARCALTQPRMPCVDAPELR